MGKLVLIRHGESMWNKMNVFTGWVDVPLSTEGIAEAQKAGEELAGIPFDAVFTSIQIRAIETAMILLASAKSAKTPVIIHSEGKMKEWTKIFSAETANNILPVFSDWHLNERYYGHLQGLNKTATVNKYGEDQVHLWRRSYDVAPPEGESLKDTAARTIPYFKSRVMEQLKMGKNVLVSAHGNSLRSIVMFIENLSPEEIVKYEIPTGKPLFYQFDGNDIQKM